MNEIDIQNKLADGVQTAMIEIATSVTTCEQRLVVLRLATQVILNGYPTHQKILKRRDMAAFLKRELRAAFRPSNASEGPTIPPEPVEARSDDVDDPAGRIAGHPKPASDCGTGTGPSVVFEAAVVDKFLERNER